MTGERHFSRETFRFPRELAQHNERPWFEANKPRPCARPW